MVLQMNKSECIDCGKLTISGPGSARCQECWDARFGQDEAKSVVHDATCHDQERKVKMTPTRAHMYKDLELYHPENGLVSVKVLKDEYMANWHEYMTMAEKVAYHSLDPKIKELVNQALDPFNELHELTKPLD